MSSDFEPSIQTEKYAFSTNCNSLVAFAIFFYDHLLTLEEEVIYVWSGKKSWGFWLFIINRYFPFTFEFWLLGTSGSYSNTNSLAYLLCKRTPWYPFFMLVVCTLIAQVVMILRIYAVTLKNVVITVGFAVVTASQFALGMWITVLIAQKEVERFSPMTSDAYGLCIFAFDEARIPTIAFTSITLLYDSLTFSLIAFLAVRSSREMGGIRFKIPTILRRIAADATLYFIAIFTSHVFLMVSLVVGWERGSFFPIFNDVVFIPAMISRLMLSLREAADPRRGKRSFGVDLATIRFARSRTGANATEGGDIPLDTHPWSRTAAR